MLAARISLILSRHSSLSFIALGRSSGQHPVSSHSCWMYVRDGRPTFARPCVGIHKSTSLMSSSLLLQQCPACLVQEICIFEFIYFVLTYVLYMFPTSCFHQRTYVAQGLVNWDAQWRLNSLLLASIKIRKMMRKCLNLKLLFILKLNSTSYKGKIWI